MARKEDECIRESIFWLIFLSPFFFSLVTSLFSAAVPNVRDRLIAAAYVETEAGNREGLPEHLMDERL